jgi:anion-transporting  ArsA/GET3 family ATPase
MSVSPLVEALRHDTVLVCVGAGGVGKTTVSASLGLRAASGEGRSSLVCTIDPARRLANSLGLSQLGNEETLIAQDVFEQANVPVRAPLHAMMLDMKRTWDELVERHAPPDARERILENRFYQTLSTRLAGSQEYIAMEKLCQLRARRDYNLIVLDTPPTAHALDFLDAPNRVLDFLDNDAARWLLSPALSAGRFGLKALQRGGSYALKTISRLTGTEMLEEMSSFMLSLSTLNESFRERAREVRDLLAADRTAFVLVTIPNRERLDEVVHFHTLLQQNKMNVAAIVVNRVHIAPTHQQFADARRVPEPLRSRLEMTLEEMRALSVNDAAAIADIHRECDPTPMVLVPRFDRDVHDLKSLWHTGRYLGGDATVSAGPAIEEAAGSRVS